MSSDLFGNIRSLLAEPLTDETYALLWHLLGKIKDREYLTKVAIPYCISSPNLKALACRTFLSSRFWEDPRSLLGNSLTLTQEVAAIRERDLPACFRSPFVQLEVLSMTSIVWDMEGWQAFLAWEGLDKLAALAFNAKGLTLDDLLPLVINRRPLLNEISVEGDDLSLYEKDILRLSTELRLSTKKVDLEFHASLETLWS